MKTEQVEAERIAEIRDRLSKIAPGPWRVISRREDDEVERYVAFGDGEFPPDSTLLSVADAEFIAQSPSDIAFLLSVLEQREKAREALVASRDVIAALAKQCGVIPHQGISATITEGERQAWRAVEDIDAILTNSMTLTRAGRLDLGREVVAVELDAAADALDTLTAALAEREQAKDGVALIAAERSRQLAVEGWSPEHDDLHDKGQMAISAARYALEDVGVFPHRAPAARYALKQLWEWESCWWKPKDPIRNLVRAGALIAAEIDRRLRLAGKSSAPDAEPMGEIPS